MSQTTPQSPIEDVQNTADTRHLAIDKVGIKAIRHPVVVKTSLVANSIQ
jgi:GTP cyclohydrolase I